MKRLWATIFSVLVIATIGCGGSGGPPAPTPTPTPTPVPTPTPPTSGEYLLVGNSSTSLNLSTINSSTGALSAPTLLFNQADDSVIYPGVAITPSKKFLYALFTSFTLVQGFQVSGPGLQLTQLKNAPFSPPVSAGPMNSMALHPSGQFLYVVESPDKIQEFTTNATTGDLTVGPTLTSGVGADFRVAVADPSGKFLFVTDLTGGRVFAYQVNSSDGSLVAVPGSPFNITATSEPSIPVIDRTGHFLYVSLISGIAAFSINSSTGALVAVPGSPFPTSNDPVFLAADPAGDFLYACNATSGFIDGFAINTVTGNLLSVGPPVITASGPSNIAVDPSGKFVYVSIETSNTIYGFSLNSSSGSLSAIAGSPFTTVSNPTNLFMASF